MAEFNNCFCDICKYYCSCFNEGNYKNCSINTELQNDIYLDEIADDLEEYYSDYSI